MSRPTRARLDQPLVAVLEKRGRFVVAEPMFQPGERLALDPRARKGAGVGDMVLLGPSKHGPKVVRRLGKPRFARDVVEGLLIDRGARRSFPKAAEVARDPGFARRDLKALPTFTVDPADARDFDDAISAESGRLWVHIADVSAFVRPGTVLDAEAFRRGTSTYVPGTVEPMLPHELSSDACSLGPGVARPAVTVEMQMSGADVRSVSFYRSEIVSDARLTYEQVDRVFAGQEAPREPWAGPLAVARELARELSARRTGSLEVESSEPAFEWDEQGNVTGVRQERQTESHELIEQLMVLTNEQVAGHLADKRVPTLYRVHERPDPSAVEQLATKLASLDVATPALPERMSPHQASEAVAEASRLVAAHVRRTGRGARGLTPLVLRSMKPAYYSPVNKGHAGLASPRYCHFTSPIRRYPDLIAHRALLASVGEDDVPPRADELPDAGVLTSAAERSAMVVERDADDVCLAFLLERAVAERGHDATWKGEIVGVVGAGWFVEFSSGARDGGEEGFEGFLPARRMRGDYFRLNEQETALTGDRSGRTIKLGDPIEVRVDRVEAPRGRVDLIEA